MGLYITTMKIEQGKETLYIVHNDRGVVFTNRDKAAAEQYILERKEDEMTLAKIRAQEKSK